MREITRPRRCGLCGTLGRTVDLAAAGGGRRNPPTLRQNINFNGSYSHSARDLRNIFFPLGGTTESNGYGVTAGYTIGYGRLTNNASINWNRSHSEQRNYFTDGDRSTVGYGDFDSEAGDWSGSGIYYGVPSLTIASFTGLTQTAANNATNQTISFSDFVSYGYKKHNMRFGLDFRRVHADSIGGNNVDWGRLRLRDMRRRIRRLRARRRRRLVLRVDRGLRICCLACHSSQRSRLGRIRRICERMSLTCMRRMTGGWLRT